MQSTRGLGGIKVVIYTHMKTKYFDLLVYLFIASSLTGCSYFDATVPGGSHLTGSADPIDTPTTTSGQKITLAQVTEQDVVNNLLQTDWSTIHAQLAAGQMKYYSIELDFDYEKALKPLSQAIRKYSPQACKFIGLPYREGAYNENEWHCGNPIDGNWKDMVTLNIPNINGSEAGFNYAMNGFQMPIRIGRGNNSGSYNESTLDNLQVTALSSSQKVGEDVSVRFRPQNTKVGLDVCLNVPGTSISAPFRNVYGHAWKQIAFVTLDLDASMDVTPGNVNFSYLRQCFSTTLGINTNTGVPYINLDKIENPHVESANLSYTNFQFKNWFTSLLSNILTLFGLNISNEINKVLQGRVANISANDVQNSQFMLEYVKQALGEQWATRVNNALVGKLNTDVAPSSAIDFKNILKRQCDRLSSLQSISDAKRFNPEVCKLALDYLELHLVPFSRDLDMKNAGCYDHYVNIHKSDDGTNYWWKNTCKFKVKIMLGVPVLRDELVDLVAQLIESIRTDVQNNQALIDALKGIQNPDIDNDTLDSIISILKGNGVNDISVEDIADYIKRNQGTIAALKTSSLGAAAVSNTY